MTVHTPPHPAADGSPPKRPKGILKNRSTSNATATLVSTAEPVPTEQQRPHVERELSEREIVLANTLRNAGAHRRSSSNPHGPPSRRQSANGVNGEQFADENSPRLKWDEANLYLTEQDRGDHMKITEPKTPYAKQYDPTEDEEEISQLNASELLVDEVDKKLVEEGRDPKIATRLANEEIPDLDIGEPDVDMDNAPTPESEKRVIVDANMAGDEGRHGEEPLDMSDEEREKHRKFKESRKQHYEMKNIKNLLGHPEQLDEDEDDETVARSVPPVPGAPAS